VDDSTGAPPEGQTKRGDDAAETAGRQADDQVPDEHSPAADHDNTGQSAGVTPEAVGEPQGEQRVHALGWDPAQEKFRPNEAQTAIRIENETGVRLERAPDAWGPDWIGSDGKTYDAVGPLPAEHFDQQWDNFQERIMDHLGKADYVPVDVSQFTPEQTAQVQEFIEPLGSRVFTVGGK
jgi:hypothetical protein